MREIVLRPFMPEEYHAFFRRYIPDPVTDPTPFTYNREQIERSYRYNYGGFQENYAHYGIFLDDEPVGSLQLKRMDPEKGTGEFGIILRDDGVKNQGIGTRAVLLAMAEARNRYHLKMLMGDTMGRNLRMIRVFEKTGFELQERIPDAFRLSDGSRQDRLVYRKKLMEEQNA